MKKKEKQRQIEALWKKLDETSKISEEAKTLARHAGRGFVELSSDMKDVNRQLTQQNTDINGLGKKFGDFSDQIREKLANNLKWTIGFIFVILTLFTGLIILTITNIK
jgi:hypothetical protein